MNDMRTKQARRVSLEVMEAQASLMQAGEINGEIGKLIRKELEALVAAQVSIKNVGGGNSSPS